MKCKVSNLCGGCVIDQMSYEETIAEKQKYLDNLFKDICSTQNIVTNYYPYK